MYNKIYRSMRFLCILTLLLSSILLLSVSYTFFNSNTKSELEKETALIATLINSSSDKINTLKNISSSENIRFTLISHDGKVLFDSDSKNLELSIHLDRPEIQEAMTKGIGSAVRFSSSLKKNFYYCAAVLENGNILRCAKPSFDVIAFFYPAFIFILLMIILIYFLSSHIASKLTANIVKPITQHLGDEYDEIRPLTERIELQNREIKRQSEYAKAQKLQLQLITDNMNEGLVITDENGTIISINNFALNIFNLREYEARNKSYSLLTSNESFIYAVSQALQKHRSTTLINIGELDYRVFCSPVIKNNTFSGVVILLFDVTSTSQSEKLRREFSANVSHELKTPLTSINGYAQIISSGLAAKDDVPGFAAKIAKESNRLMILIEDIIRLSNLDEGVPAEEEKTAFSLKDIVIDVMSSLSDKAQNRSVAMQCEGEDFYINANKSQITELIYNICDNAIKYNKDNGSVTFTLSGHTLSITDTGIGIPGEYLGRIFERFFRVDKSHSKKVDGTGLGLSIVKHIAKQNYIDIDVKSTLGAGTTFVLTFNCVKNHV